MDVGFELIFTSKRYLKGKRLQLGFNCSGKEPAIVESSRSPPTRDATKSSVSKRHQNTWHNCKTLGKISAKIIGHIFRSFAHLLHSLSKERKKIAFKLMRNLDIVI